jgi:hypothetical protein
VEQSHSWEANRCWASYITSLLSNPKFQYYYHKSSTGPHLEPTESSSHPRILFKIDLNIILASTPRYFLVVCEAIGTAATTGLLCQPRMIVTMIVEKQMECRLAGETEVQGENLPQRHFCPSQNPTWPDLGLNPGRIYHFYSTVLYDRSILFHNKSRTTHTSTDIENNGGETVELNFGHFYLQRTILSYVRLPKRCIFRRH